MRNLVFLVILFSTVQLYANEEAKCQLPAGKFTDLEMVMNQFVFNDGNPNWGDWCYEGNPEDSKSCNEELDQWDNWLKCSDLVD